MGRAPRICCFDLDTFFVSVERLRDPSLELVLRLRLAFDGQTPELGRARPAFQEHDPQGSTLGSLSNESTFSAWSRPLAIRLLGVQLSNLVGPEPQLELPFSPQRQASPALDAVRERFGFGAIRRGGGAVRR